MGDYYKDYSFRIKNDIVQNHAHTHTPPHLTTVSNIALVSRETGVTDSCQSWHPALLRKMPLLG